MHAFLKLVAGLILMGSVGSLEIDRIGFTQYFVQCALGCPYGLWPSKVKQSDGSKGDNDETETNHPDDAVKVQF